jgi:methionine sulfoxide reductase heme-binding subunit
MHVTSSPAIWYAARASGVAAYVVLSLVVCLGMTLGGKAQSRRWPRFSVEDVHRFGGLLVGSLLGVHVLTIAADSFLPFSLTQLLVPFTSSYRPLWTGLGIAAAELLLALAITNHYRKRLPYSFWRKAHYLNFAVWTLASVHGLMSGTDRGAAWLAILYGVSVASVLMLLVWRFGGSRRLPRIATTGAVTVVALPLLIIGPLRHSPPLWNAAHVNENLTGSVIRNGTQTQQIVSFVGRSERPQKLLVRADLLVAPGALEKTSLQLEYLPSGDVCRGQVTNVGGESFSGTCRLSNGELRTIDARWVPNSAGTGVVGQITLSD